VLLYDFGRLFLLWPVNVLVRLCVSFFFPRMGFSVSFLFSLGWDCLFLSDARSQLKRS
jgi:hypothetical protein